MYFLFFILFFKQKTAYELRISDWSSDVCSSDLFAGFVALTVDVVGKEEVDGLALVEGLLHPAVALRDFDANPLEGSDQARPVDLFDLANAIKEKIDIFTRTVLVERADRKSTRLNPSH